MDDESKQPGAQEVPSDAPTERRARVVVGTDGSAGSETALRWAIAYAEQCDSELEVLVAWDFVAQWAAGANPAWPNDAAHLEADAVTLGERSVAAALDGRTRPAWLHVVAVQGTPALALTERARGADLLVVGSRGRGGFSKLVLGSVSKACVQHATCPTVVVPPLK